MSVDDEEDDTCRSTICKSRCRDCMREDVCIRPYRRIRKERYIILKRNDVVECVGLV